LEAKQEEKNRNNDEIKQLEKKIKDMQKKSDQLSSTNRSLRQEANRYQTQISDLQTKQAQKNQAMEDKTSQLDGEVKKLNNEKDALQKNREECLRLIKEKERENTRLVSKIHQYEADLDRKQQELIASENKAKESLITFQKSQESLGEQVAKYQNAYKTCRTQVENLKENNNQLRSELNELHHQQGIKLNPEAA